MVKTYRKGHDILVPWGPGPLPSGPGRSGELSGKPGWLPRVPLGCEEGPRSARGSLRSDRCKLKSAQRPQRIHLMGPSMAQGCSHSSKCNKNHWLFNDFQHSPQHVEWRPRTPKETLRNPRPVQRDRQGRPRRLQGTHRVGPLSSRGSYVAPKGPWVHLGVLH